MNYTKLNLWSQAINGDVNSKSVFPYFASEENPLPYQRELNGAGIPVDGILLDINGKIRNDKAPDVGCVEFTVDFGVTDMISPTLECNHSNIDSVKVLLRQFGDIPFINLRLAYQVNNGNIHYDMIPGTIYNDLVYTFNTSVDLSTEGIYHFKIWLINAMDDNINNDTLHVVRYSKPSPVVNFTASNKCTGSEVFFTGTATITSPYFIDKYEWNFGDGEKSENQNPAHRYAKVGTYNVTLRAYSDAGCYNEITKQVIINGYEKLELNFNVKDETCFKSCNGEIEVIIKEGEAPYKIYVNDVLSSSTTIMDLCAGTYKIRVLDNIGCEASGELVVKTGLTFAHGITADPSVGNVPLTVNLSAIQSPGTTYEWFYKESVFDTQANTSIVFHELGEHEIILKSTGAAPNYCTYQDTVKIKVELLIDFIIPNAFTPNGDGYNDTFGAVTQGIKTLNMIIKDRNGRFVHAIDSINGSWNGLMPSGSLAPVGVYYYKLEATGYDDNFYTRKGSVSLFRDLIDVTPNPVKNTVKIDLKNQFSNAKTITIHSTSGELKLIKETTANVIILDVERLPSGLYILKVANKNQVEYAKFIKE